MLNFMDLARSGDQVIGVHLEMKRLGICPFSVEKLLFHSHENHVLFEHKHYRFLSLLKKSFRLNWALPTGCASRGESRLMNSRAYARIASFEIGFGLKTSAMKQIYTIRTKQTM